MPKILVWCDTETTGLDPKTHKLIEIAIGFTDVNFEVLETLTFVLPCPDLESVYNETAPFVQEMHTKNGLWADVHAATPVIEVKEGMSHQDVLGQQWRVEIKAKAAIEQVIIEAMSRYGLGENARTRCHGYNPAFDLGFLAENMPRLHRCFDHNKGDVRALEHFCLLWGLEKHKPVNHNHRALDDLLDEIEAAKHYRRELRV